MGISFMANVRAGASQQIGSSVARCIAISSILIFLTSAIDNGTFIGPERFLPACNLHEGGYGYRTPSSILPARGDATWLYPAKSEIEHWYKIGKSQCMTFLKSHTFEPHANVFSDAKITGVGQNKCRGNSALYSITGVLVWPFGPIQSCPTYSKCWFGLLTCGSPKLDSMHKLMAGKIRERLRFYKLSEDIPPVERWSIGVLNIHMRLVGPEIVTPDRRLFTLSSGMDRNPDPNPDTTIKTAAPNNGGEGDKQMGQTEGTSAGRAADLDDDVVIAQYTLTVPSDEYKLELRLLELYGSALIDWSTSNSSAFADAINSAQEDSRRSLFPSLKPLINSSRNPKSAAAVASTPIEAGSTTTAVGNGSRLGYALHLVVNFFLGGSEGRCPPYTRCSVTNYCCGCDEKSFVFGSPFAVAAIDAKERCTAPPPLPLLLPTDALDSDSEGRIEDAQAHREWNKVSAVSRGTNGGEVATEGKGAGTKIADGGEGTVRAGVATHGTGDDLQERLRSERMTAVAEVDLDRSRNEAIGVNREAGPSAVTQLESVAEIEVESGEETISHEKAQERKERDRDTADGVSAGDAENSGNKNGDLSGTDYDMARRESSNALAPEQEQHEQIQHQQQHQEQQHNANAKVSRREFNDSDISNALSATTILSYTSGLGIDGISRRTTAATVATSIGSSPGSTAAAVAGAEGTLQERKVGGSSRSSSSNNSNPPQRLPSALPLCPAMTSGHAGRWIQSTFEGLRESLRERGTQPCERVPDDFCLAPPAKAKPGPAPRKPAPSKPAPSKPVASHVAQPAHNPASAKSALPRSAPSKPTQKTPTVKKPATFTFGLKTNGVNTRDRRRKQRNRRALASSSSSISSGRSRDVIDAEESMHWMSRPTAGAFQASASETAAGDRIWKWESGEDVRGREDKEVEAWKRISANYSSYNEPPQRSLQTKPHASVPVTPLPLSTTPGTVGAFGKVGTQETGWFEASGNPCQVNISYERDLRREERGEGSWFFAPYACRYHFYTRSEALQCFKDKEIHYIMFHGDSMSRDLFGAVSNYLGVSSATPEELKELTNIRKMGHVKHEGQGLLISEMSSWSYNKKQLSETERAPIPDVFVTNNGFAHRNGLQPSFSEAMQKEDVHYWRSERPATAKWPRYMIFQNAADVHGRRNTRAGWCAENFRELSSLMQREYEAMGFAVLDEFQITTARLDTHNVHADGWHYRGTKRLMGVMVFFNMLCNDWVTQ